jgi:methylamine dehydrogenase heavy chain
MAFSRCSKHILGYGALLLAACPGPVLAQAADLQPEEPFVQTMAPPQPHWAYVRDEWDRGGLRIYNADNGKMLGTIETATFADVRIDPAGKYYYVSETIWAKGNRGARQDMVTIYDTKGNKLQTEIAIPGRLVIDPMPNNFVLSDDGTMGFVFNYDPAASVNVVDLAKRKFVRAIELPGCASLMPNPVGFSALCSDGAIATVAIGGAKPKITRSKSFFPSNADPIFDNFIYDKTRKQATFLTYTGLVYQAILGAEPEISEPFSIQEAAGVRRGETRPLDVNWMPGGRELMALHKPSGHLYVLMHVGEYWSHKEAGEEIWDIDIAAHKVVKRRPLKEKVANIAVTQDAEPLLFLNNEKGTLFILDAKTMEEKKKIEKAGPGIIMTADVGTPATLPAAGN